MANKVKIVNAEAFHVPKKIFQVIKALRQAVSSFRKCFWRKP